MLSFDSRPTGYRRELTLIDAVPSGEEIARPLLAGTSILSGAPIARIAPRYEPGVSRLPSDRGPTPDGVPLMLRIQVLDAALSPLDDVPVMVEVAAPRCDDGGRHSVRVVGTTGASGIAEIETVFPAARAGESPTVTFHAALDQAAVRGVIALPDEVRDFLSDHVAPYRTSPPEDDAPLHWQPSYLAQVVISADRSAPSAASTPQRKPLPVRSRRWMARTMASRIMGLVLAATGIVGSMFATSGSRMEHGDDGVTMARETDRPTD